VRRDRGFELKVTDPQEEIREGEAKEDEGKDELKLKRFQDR
jgi:hypothetical protein